MRGVIDVFVGQIKRDDLAAVCVKTNMQFAPGAAFRSSMFFEQPFAGSAQFQPRAVNDQVQVCLLYTSHGRMNWQKASGYNMRSKVEAAISRYKRVIGDILKSRDDARRVTEVAIAVKSLNRMRDLGQAICVRVA